MFKHLIYLFYIGNAALFWNPKLNAQILPKAGETFKSGPNPSQTFTPEDAKRNQSWAFLYYWLADHENFQKQLIDSNASLLKNFVYDSKTGKKLKRPLKHGNDSETSIQSNEGQSELISLNALQSEDFKEIFFKVQNMYCHEKNSNQEYCTNSEKQEEIWREATLSHLKTHLETNPTTLPGSSPKAFARHTNHLLLFADGVKCRETSMQEWNLGSHSFSIESLRETLDKIAKSVDLQEGTTTSPAKKVNRALKRIDILSSTASKEKHISTASKSKGNPGLKSGVQVHLVGASNPDPLSGGAPPLPEGRGLPRLDDTHASLEKSDSPPGSQKSLTTFKNSRPSEGVNQYDNPHKLQANLVSRASLSQSSSVQALPPPPPPPASTKPNSLLPSQKSESLESGGIDNRNNPKTEISPETKEKIRSTMILQLQEIYTSEKTFSRDLHLLLDRNITPRRTLLGAPPKEGSIIDSFIYNKLITNKSELETVRQSISALTEIMKLSDSLIHNLKPAFDLTENPDLRNDSAFTFNMETSLINHLKINSIKSAYHTYFMNQEAFSKILSRVEKSKEGRKLLEEQIKNLNNRQNGAVQGANRLNNHPTSIAITPVQRLPRYTLLINPILKSIEAKGEPFHEERYDELLKLKNDIHQVTTEINQDLSKIQKN